MTFNCFNGLNDGCPCKDCKNRYSECHSNCKKYAEWKVKTDKVKADLRLKADMSRYGLPLKPVRKERKK